MTDLELLRLEIETCEIMVSRGRFKAQNSPEQRPGPLVALAGCADGNVCACHIDLGEALALRVEAFVAAAPPWREADRLAPWVATLAELVGVDPASLTGGPAWLLPHDVAFDSDATMVAGESAEGAALVARFGAEGMPPALVEAGYVNVDELWAPWCAAMVGDEVAALCCAARVTDTGAEVGLYSFPPHRRQGYGAAVTAAWSRLPSLKDRTLFYSTHFTNHSSQRVTERLGLHRLGSSVGIGYR